MKHRVYLHESVFGVGIGVRHGIGSKSEKIKKPNRDTEVEFPEWNLRWEVECLSFSLDLILLLETSQEDDA